MLSNVAYCDKARDSVPAWREFSLGWKGLSLLSLPDWLHNTHGEHWSLSGWYLQFSLCFGFLCPTPLSFPSFSWCILILFRDTKDNVENVHVSPSILGCCEECPSKGNLVPIATWTSSETMYKLHRTMNQTCLAFTFASSKIKITTVSMTITIASPVWCFTILPCPKMCAALSLQRACGIVNVLVSVPWWLIWIPVHD